MKELVSVAIVNWNGEKYLYKCIKSLLNQKYKNIEVIIIDNDSTDNSVKIIEDNFKNDVILCRNKNITLKMMLSYVGIKIQDMLVGLIRGSS